MSVKVPNSEQERAIDHLGGVLLNAGAGSGKTYVIVEHINHLLNSFIKDLNFDVRDLALKEIKTFMSSIVVITYTKDAAGELLNRIKWRVKQNSCDNDQNDIWSFIHENIAIMNIGTVHSFCLRFLAAENSKIIGKKIGIIDDYAYKDNIENGIGEWVDKDIRRQDVDKKIVINNYETILTAMGKCLSDAQLRLYWEEFNLTSFLELDLTEYFEELLDVMGIDLASFKKMNLENYSEYIDKGWYGFINGFLTLLREGLPTSSGQFDKYMAHFDSFSRVQAPKKIEEANSVFLLIRSFRDVLKKHRDDYSAYFSGEIVGLKTWLTTLKDLFDFLNSNYSVKHGISFADIEYYALKALNDDEFAARINKRYQYIVVDEFQDTSHMQFEIVKRILNNDYSKLFAVGDLKQAIYGFRGGELKVFKECSKLLKVNLSLLSNYRSHDQVVSFNNKFFSALFPLDSTLKKEDRHSVAYDGQIAISPNSSESGVERTIVCLQDKSKSKLTFDEINDLEARAIVLKIKEALKVGKYKQICVLYKKLGPSSFLINRLIKEDIGFSAQVKISYEEEPLLAIFYQLILVSIDRENIEKQLFYILGYMTFLNQDIQIDLIRKAVEQFIVSSKLTGVYHSFLSFLYYLRVSTSNHSINLQIIHTVCQNESDNFEKIGLRFDGIKGDKITTNFAYGENSAQVLIKTCHSTKGLEYDYCILAGIHTNGRRMGNRSVLGNYPSSIQWNNDIDDKDKYKSPAYILEQILGSLKDFSESKRLLYVAATRSVKKLAWIELYDKDSKLLSSGNSWANLISQIVERHIDIAKTVDRKELQFIAIENNSSHSVGLKAPLFHTDSGGIIKREEIFDRNELGLIGEISVRKLAELALCRRKFYYAVICNLSEEDFSKISELTEGSLDKNSIDEKGTLPEEKVEPPLSNSKRGTRIHQQISDIITGLTTFEELRINNKDDENAVSFAIQKFNNKRVEKVYSEKTLKFKLFGIMLTGIPDLVIVNKKESKCAAEVWDFKTGSKNDATDATYWFQLYAYAYGIYRYKIVDPDSLLLLSIVYLDEQKCDERMVSFSEVRDHLFEQWRGISSFERVRSAECKHCLYDRLLC